jgi:phosphoglycolate phosphatase
MPAAPRDAAARIEGVVFDLDGTLVDAFEGISTAANAARARFSLPPLPRSEITRHVGRGVADLIAAVVGGNRREEGVRVFREVYERVCEAETRALPGARPVLLALSRLGVPAGVASNKPAAFSERILLRLGLRPLLACVFGPDTAGALKPDPVMIHACLRAMRVDPGDALYVGDMPYDAESGARAGVRTVLVAGGAAADADLHATGEPVITDLAELVAIVERSAHQK